MTDSQIEMLSDQQLYAKMRRLGKRWTKITFSHASPEKMERYIQLTKKLNRLDKEYLKRIEKGG